MSAIWLEPGDIILVHGHGKIPRLIRWFTRSPGESRTRVSHCALALDSTHIIEALHHVTVRQLGNAYDPKYYEVWRASGLSLAKRRKIIVKAQSYNGRSYGYLKLALQAMDGLLGGLYVFRRLAFVDSMPICSWLVAASYKEAGLNFGVPVGAITPDDIHDFVRKHPDKYFRAHP